MNLCRKTVNFMNIALIESDILWGDPKANLARNASAISCLLDKGAVSENDLVLLPECFSTGYAMTLELVEPEEGSAALEWLLRTAADNKIALFTSLAVEKDGKYYNRGYFILPEGRVAAVYDKRHLFMGDEAGFYTAGDGISLVDYCGWRFSLNICYDLRFPVWSRNVKDKDGKYYDVILNVSNWPTSRLDVSDLLTKARALENQSYLFFCNRVGADPLTVYSGGSAAVDAKGRSIGKRFDLDGTGCIVAALDRLWLDSFREYFPVLEDGDGFVLEK